MGPSLNSLFIEEDIPAFGNAALIAGVIIDIHSASVNVHAGNGYLSLAPILVCSAVHASSCDELPNLILPAQSNAAFLRYSIVFFLSPLGVNQTPSISDASSHLNCFNDTLSPSILVATKSIPISGSFAIHFPLFHT